MTAYLWSKAGLDVDANVQSVLIYSITAAHIVMAVAAMVFVGLMAFRALAGGYDARQYDGIAASALFWHVMVAVYAVIWIAIYVTK
jgi:heme/copper-type cytochrome/quinol oxidase subunit 3